MGARLEREVADSTGPEHAVRHEADRGLRGRKVQVGGERRKRAVMAGVVIAHNRCCLARARLAACGAGFRAEIKKRCNRCKGTGVLQHMQRYCGVWAVQERGQHAARFPSHLTMVLT